MSDIPNNTVTIEITINDKKYTRTNTVYDTSRAKLQFSMDAMLVLISNEINQDFPA